MKRYTVDEDLEPLAIGEITKEMIAEYSRVSNDMNPMHTDEELARSAGYPGVFAQGMLGMAQLSKYIVGVCGVGKLLRIKVRFKTMTWPGERITCRAKVTDVNEEGGRHLVTCDIHTENQEGEPRVVGTATFAA
jgi:acyl dehydratase